MKKSFFKKLSFVLALAMIVSTIAPAAGAFAATSPKINTAKKYLLLGQTSEYDFSVANKIAGSTYKWSSSNKAVATVDQKGLAVAKSVGTAKITVKVTTKTKKTYSSTATVIVKDNFKSLTITGAPADGKAAVGAEVALGTTGTTYGGATSSASAIVRFAVADKDGKATTDATVSDAGVFKATVAGTYTVTANAFQSTAKYDAWKTTGTGATATASTTITVANTATIKQVDVSSFNLTFSSPVETLAVADVVANYLVGTTEVSAVVKEVKLSTDKLSAKVTMYGSFNTGSTYNVVVKGFDKLTFVAAKTDVTDVASMTITPVTVAVNKATKVVVKMFNKDGVDITTANLLGKVTMANSSEKTWLDGNSADTTTATPYKINIYKIGDTTTLTATLHSYTYDATTGVEKDTKTATATVTGVAAVTYTTSGISAWNIGAAAVTDFTNAKHTLAANDGTKVLSVKTTLNDSDNTAVCSATVGTVTDNPNGKFKFESSDSTVLVVNTKGDGTGADISPVKAGTVNVVVSYTADASVTNPVYTVVGAVAITVGADRTATTLNLNTYSFNLSSSAAVLAGGGTFADTKDVDVEVLDQYGDKVNIAVGSVTVDLNSTSLPNMNPTVTYPESQKARINFNGQGKTAGQYSYKVTVAKLVKYITITVANPSTNSGAAGNYVRLNISGTSFDKKLSNTTHAVSATIGLLEYATNGIPIKSVNVSGAGYTVKVIDPDGNQYTNATALTGNTPGSALATLKVISGTSASGDPLYVALKNGTWKVTLTNSNNTVVDSASFEVKDTTTAPSVKVNTVHPTATTLANAINEAFTVSLSTGDLNNSTTNKTLYTVSGDVVGSGSSVFVKNVRYYDTVLQYEYVISVTNTLYAPSGATY